MTISILRSIFIVGFVFTINSLIVYAGILPITDLGEGSGCSALSKPDVDCDDFHEITCCEDISFSGTMGRKGIEVRPGKNDNDSDGESDGIEACICDALDNNPNLNVNPGDGSVCDSSIPQERDQFVGTCTLGSQLQGQNYQFSYTFTNFPNDICEQED